MAAPNDARGERKPLTMSWVRLDDGYMNHPKFVRLIRFGWDAFGLWHGFRAWCAKTNTDGFIAVDMVDEPKGPPQPRREECVAAMVETRLLEKVESGYQMHDYLDWAHSKEDVEKERADSRERSKRYRDNLRHRPSSKLKKRKANGAIRESQGGAE
jgi:hypothetical protein